MPRRSNHKHGGGYVPPPPGGTGISPPDSYTTDTSQTIYSEPTLPNIGSAGSAFIDPTFGSLMLRITDANTRPDRVNRSWTGPSSAENATFNTNQTIFYVIGVGGGEVVPYSFNASAMTVARMGDLNNGSGGLVLLPTDLGEPSFSFVDPNKLYGTGGSNGRTLRYYSFQSSSYVEVVDLDTLISGLSGVTGGTSNSSADILCTYCGGTSQDLHKYVVTYNPTGAVSHILDTNAGTIDGGANTDITWGWLVHNARIDKSGRYVTITKAGTSNVYVWDVQAAHVAFMDPAGGGHKVGGHGVVINNDSQSGHPFSSKQYLYRTFAALGTITDLVNYQVVDTTSDSHLSWNQAQPDRLVPVLVSSYRLVTDASAWRQYDNEVIAVKTDVPTTIWRFCHSRSFVRGSFFWDSPRGNVSQDGRWFVFASNWGETLGTDEDTVNKRVDAFMVKLAAP